MILSGILHTSLGGFTVIRGVAPLGDLARCSRFDPTYQRSLIDGHRVEIEQFLDDGQFLFFPEVVLSASLRFDYSKSTKRDVRPLGDLFTGKGFSSNVDDLSIRVVKTRLPQGMEVVGGSQAPMLAYLTIPEDQLEREDGLRLSRIDGNHRLSAADGVTQNESRYSLETPFCIVLHEDPTQAQRFEKVVFHNINAKQVPLTSEQNLHLILQSGADALFSDDELLDKPSFGPAYRLARALALEFDAKFLTGFTKHFENRYTLALGLAQFLMEEKLLPNEADAKMLNDQLPRLRNALKEANKLYEKKSGEQLRTSGCHGVLTAFVYFALENEGKQLPAFARWIEANRIDRLAPPPTRGLGYPYHLGHTHAVDAASLVAVFKSILKARSREVFISMEFGTHTDPVYQAIEKAIEEVNHAHRLKHVDLALQPIRIDRLNKGHSYTIADEILQVVNGCGLLIADLTQGNKNVYHEVGFLMGLNQGRSAPQDNLILLVDARHIREKSEASIGFNLRHWQQIRFNDTLDLTQKLRTALEAHFNLETPDDV